MKTAINSSSTKEILTQLWLIGNRKNFGRPFFSIILLLASFISYSQTTGMLIDEQNGKKYKTVKIGNQWWMAENLVVNGTNYINYNTALKACPVGWKLPSKNDFENLMMNFCTGKNGKYDYDVCGKGSFLALKYGGTSGLNFALNGYEEGGYTYWNGSHGLYWSSDIYTDAMAKNFIIFPLDDNGTAGVTEHRKVDGLNVRCICSDNQSYESQRKSIASYGVFSDYVLGQTKSSAFPSCNMNGYDRTKKISDYITNKYKQFGDNFNTKDCNRTFNLMGYDFDMTFYFYKETLFEIVLNKYRVSKEDAAQLALLFVDKYGKETRTTQSGNTSTMIWEDNQFYTHLSINNYNGISVEIKYWSKNLMNNVFSDFQNTIENRIKNEGSKF